MSLRMVRPKVDLPQPDSPTNPSVSPSLMVKLTPSTAFTLPFLRENNPSPTGKYFFKSRISNKLMVRIGSRRSLIEDRRSVSYLSTLNSPSSVFPVIRGGESDRLPDDRAPCPAGVALGRRKVRQHADSDRESGNHWAD